MGASRAGRRPRTVAATVVLLLVAVLVAVLGSLAGPARPAEAHAVLVSMDPAPGALLDAPPERIAVGFNEPVETTPVSLTVIDASGAVVSSPAVGEGSTVSVTVPADVTGWHAVSWRITSLDGHPLSGAWTFRVGEGSAEAPTDLAERAADASATTTVARWGWTGGQALSAVGAVVLAGTAFLTVTGIRREAAARVGLVAVTGLVTIVASLVAAAANGPFTAGGGLIDDVFGGPASGPHLARSALAAVVTVVVVSLGTIRRTIAVAAWLAALGALVVVPASTGHAPTAGALAQVTVAAHLVVAACWLGAIPGLLLEVRRGRRPLAATAGRFSVAAGRLLAATVVVGAVAAFVLSGGPDEVNGRWGWLLVAKLVLVAVAVAAGSWNRWRALPAGGRRLLAALAIEAVALVAIVLVSVAMTHNGPPREVERGPVVVDVPLDDDLRVNLVVDPGRTGSNWIHLYTLDPAGLPVDVEDVTVSFSSAERGIEPIEQLLSDAGSGHRLGVTSDLGLPGRWRADISVRVDRFTEVSGSSSLWIEG